MEQNDSEYPVLIAQVGPLNGQRWIIKEAVVIGRDAGCDVVIPDRQVSRYHARLIPSANGIIFEDLGSKNGSFCNGQLLAESQVLQDGDLVQIALAQYFIFLSSDATMPLEGKLPGEEPAQSLQLDSRSRRVWIHHQEVLPPLSGPQFRLLQVLYEQPGKVVSRDELIDAIWGGQQAEGVSEQALDALIRRLRERLELIKPDHNFITTVRGHGLRFDNPLS
jgi:hypothetical protein